MKKLIGLFGVFLLNTQTLASSNEPMEPVLDKVAFQISAKRWVTTKTALLSVNINVTLDRKSLIKARADIMNHLEKIAHAEWHLTRFERSQDSSGLEKLTVQAQSRVSQEALSDIYNKAKSVSAPGANYQIDAIDFTPSLNETEVVKNRLREELYQQVQHELGRINKVYPGQSYSLYNMVFIDGDNVAPLTKNYQAREVVNTMVMAAKAPALTVSNELQMTAIVQVASIRQTGD